ncbi:UNVERIFIED_CONTAM: hypothetical protein GTU68_001908 [Idotea baltica]|nr:hypothetical protein [Idotea baltica]
MEYEVDIMLRQHWNDPRLQFYDEHLDILVLNEKKKKIWTSDLFFRNAKSSAQHEVTKPNQLIWLSRNGDILFSQKISLTLSCTMNLINFPLDIQTCYIEIGSFGYSIRQLDFEWLNKSNHHLNVELNPSIKLNEFYKPGVYTTSCAKKYITTGSFACLKVELIFSRKFGFYLIYTYVPSVLVVVISWLSFFVDFTVVPGRVTLCLLSLLSLITQSSATIQSLPRVSYIKAMDVWLFTCLAFVVASLVEFAMVNSMCREKPHVEQTDDQKQTNSSHKEQENVDDTLIKSKSLVNKKEGHFKKYFDIEFGHKIDKALQMIFPSMFLLFNIIYWAHYWKAHEIHTNSP